MTKPDVKSLGAGITPDVNQGPSKSFPPTSNPNILSKNSDTFESAKTSALDDKQMMESILDIYKTHAPSRTPDVNKLIEKYPPPPVN